ncbi:MAG TPA: hypothetical protein VG742_05785 [Dongiaceae bacterium]|nr:hypothetical protein [Dongiaceae bacterium]
MKKTLIAATALVILGAPLAVASGNLTPTGMLKGKPPITETYQVSSASPSAQCIKLEQQFSKASSEGVSMKAYHNAVRLSNEGRNLCSTDRSLQGIAKLERALHTIGVKPAMIG